MCVPRLILLLLLVNPQCDPARCKNINWFRNSLSASSILCHRGFVSSFVYCERPSWVFYCEYSRRACNVRVRGCAWLHVAGFITLSIHVLLYLSPSLNPLHNQVFHCHDSSSFLHVHDIRYLDIWKLFLTVYLFVFLFLQNMDWLCCLFYLSRDIVSVIYRCIAIWHVVTVRVYT